jgi:lysophospholipase L1-like esterase
MVEVQKALSMSRGLAQIYNTIKDDFLFIQFGHNDAKLEDASRYCEAFGEYQENLERFVNVARNKSAHPLLITPLCRRWFENSQQLQSNIHGEYPNAMKTIARELNVPVVDLFESSKQCIEQLGESKSKAYFMNLMPLDYVNYPEGLEDNTHLKYEGAIAFAHLIAIGLKELGGIYKELLLDPDKL